MPRNRSEKHDPVHTYLMHRYLVRDPGASNIAEPAGLMEKAWLALTDAQRRRAHVLSWHVQDQIGKEACDAA